jgi:anti-sigma regulatory factor (Ser/Thr protein kinase)
MSGSGRRYNGTGARPPAEPALDQPFDSDHLVALRSTVAAHADRLGLAGERIGDLVLVAHELASNAVRHGGGRGRLRLWRDHGSLYCAVSDEGPGFAGTGADGHQRPALGASGGRGLWIVRQLADDVDVRSDPAGTTVTARVRLG